MATKRKTDDRLELGSGAGYFEIGKRQYWRPLITPSLLMAAGYKTWTNSFKKNDTSYRGSFQKRVTDERGTRYFINFEHSHFTYHDGRGDMESVVCEAQFSRGGVTFNVETIQGFDITLEQTETLIGDIWTGAKCDYYECFDGDERNVPQGDGPSNVRDTEEETQ